FPKVGPIVVGAAVVTRIISAIVIMLSELFSGRALRPTDAAPEASEAEAVFEEKHVPQAAPAVAAARKPVRPGMLAVVAD
ncbi:chain-length determining protein, partial [Rhizobium ruizarguesonis]